jgi:hypothetical protein
MAQRKALLAVCLVVALAGCSDNEPGAPSPVAGGATPTETTDAGLVANQKRLSRADSLRLVAWAKAFRKCMTEHGVALGKPVATLHEIAMSLPGKGESVIEQAVACGDQLGGPPSDTSLQTQGTRIVFYLPRQCLLDEKVARDET